MAHLASDYYPEAVLHEAGGLSASIYRCHGQQGEYFMTNFVRTFEYEGKTYVTDSFRYENLLPLAHLAKRAYVRIKTLKDLVLDAPSLPEPGPE